MQISYAVTWQEPDGSLGTGRLEIGAEALLLDGRNGAPVTRAISYDEISGFRFARSNERLEGRPTLVVDLGTGSLRIASVAEPGIVSELAARLSALCPDKRLSERLTLVVPLKPGAKASAAALLANGPPFDPTDLGLDSHEVFLTEHEAVFVFEGVPAALLARSAEAETLWDAVKPWEPLVDGSIRFAERMYSWPS